MSTNTSVIHVKGTPISVPSVCVDGRTVITTGKWLKTGSVQDEDLVEGEAVHDAKSFVSQLRASNLRADIFTFVQRLPETEPKYSYRMELDNFAVIPITTMSDWLENRVDSGTRRAIKKASKSGVVVRPVEFSDDLVQGIVNINDETPVRQGRPFWHFRKSFDEVKRENSTYSDRTEFLGAYHNAELIGYMRITYTDDVANIVQILSLMQHYDKRPANALIAKAVELCEQKGIKYLLYYKYIYNDPKSSLTEFKRRNGFEQVLLPRYYIPLTARGKIALALGLHHGLLRLAPQRLVTRLRDMRKAWYERRHATNKAL